MFWLMCSYVNVPERLRLLLLLWALTLTYTHYSNCIYL